MASVTATDGSAPTAVLLTVATYLVCSPVAIQYSSSLSAAVEGTMTVNHDTNHDSTISSSYRHLAVVRIKLPFHQEFYIIINVRSYFSLGCFAI